MSQAELSSPPQPLYERYVNPQWVRLLDVLGMNVHYATCVGSELFTDDGRRTLDFNSGYCVHNVGHNHPGVARALKDELDRNGPAMLQGHVPEIAGELAERLARKRAASYRRCFSAAREARASRRLSSLLAPTLAGLESCTPAAVSMDSRAARYR